MLVCRYLLTEQSRLRSVNDIMPMIGARFYTQLDASQMRNDVIEEDLAKVRKHTSWCCICLSYASVRTCVCVCVWGTRGRMCFQVMEPILVLHAAAVCDGPVEVMQGAVVTGCAAQSEF